MPQTALMIVTDAAHALMDQVLGAMGEGYGGFANGTYVAAIGDPSVITHRLLNQAGASDVLAAQLVAMASSQTAPSIAPNVWGEAGTIGIEDAQAAMLEFTVITYAGPAIDMAAWRNNELAGLGLTWWVNPEE